MDVYLSTTDGRQLLLSRYTEPDADQRLLLAQMKLQLPKQPPPKNRCVITGQAPFANGLVVLSF